MFYLCLFVCLFVVCPLQNTENNYEHILMKCFGAVGRGLMNNL